MEKISFMKKKVELGLFAVAIHIPSTSIFFSENLQKKKKIFLLLFHKVLLENGEQKQLMLFSQHLFPNEYFQLFRCLFFITKYFRCGQTP